MTLIGNRSVINKSPGRFLSGTAVSGDRDSFSKHGMRRNAFQTFDAKAAVPYGALSPVAWVLPKKGGGMSAHFTAIITIDTAAKALMGLPTSGESTFVVNTEATNILPLDDTPQAVTGTTVVSFSSISTSVFPLDDTPQNVTGTTNIIVAVSPVDGKIVVSANGTATINVMSNNPLLIASVSGQGTSTFQITVVPPILGAEASLIGNASFSFTSFSNQRYPIGLVPPVLSASSSMSVAATSISRFPVSDLSPIRSAAALFTVNGILNPHAIGILGGSTEDTTGVTPDSVAQAVWTALATDMNIAGTMGKKLIDVSGGVSGGGLTEEQNAAIISGHLEAKLTRQIVSNRVVISEDVSGAKIITVFDDDGITPIKVLTLSIDGFTRDTV